jgi:Cysteine rich repeat
VADPAVAKFMATCKADVEKYCGDAVAQRKAANAAAKTGDAAAAAPKGKGRGQVVACLNTNIASLTPECKTAFEERKAAAKAKKS